MRCSKEPSIRWKTLVRVAGEAPDSAKIRALREEIRTSPRAQTLIASRDRNFIREPNVYARHFAARIGRSSRWPISDIHRATKGFCRCAVRVLAHWLADAFYREFQSKVSVPKHRSAEGVRGGPHPGAVQRRSNGKTIHPNFRMFHCPLFWHYDILGGLLAMAEMDSPKIHDAPTRSIC